MTSVSDHALSRDYSESHDHLPIHSASRPLIDLVTNDWQHTQRFRDGSFESQDSYSHFMSEKDGFKPPVLPNWLLKFNVPRRVQRYLLGYVLFLVACWLGWLYYIRPAWQQERLLDDSLAAATKSKTLFGANIRPSFPDMIHLQELDPSLLPAASKAADKRLIFIGDVHGCTEELHKLLDKVNFVKDQDHVIFTGDLIAKGPDSRGAVDLAMRIGASCVRGNHEDRTLLAYNSLTAKVHPLPGPQEDPHAREDYLDEESFSHGDYKSRALAKSMSQDQIRWLKMCPVILDVGNIEGFNGGGSVFVAHAGLAPGVDMDRQDPFLVMNMRSIDLVTRVPSEDRKGEPWEKLWNHHQSHTHPSSQRATVIYGHDSKRGLNINKYSKGLDSGCVRGGKLTALVMDKHGRQKIVRVDCPKYSSQPGT